MSLVLFFYFFYFVPVVEFFKFLLVFQGFMDDGQIINNLLRTHYTHLVWFWFLVGGDSCCN